jgi:hypothetical protein
VTRENLADPVPDAPIAGPPARKKRSWGMIAAAISCWFVGTHVVVFVPGVILFLLIKLCLEEGWGEILPTRFGLLMILMTAFSALSTTAWMLAGLAFFRSRVRRGWAWVLGALGSGGLTVLVFLVLRFAP